MPNFLLERRKGGLKPRIPASRPRARRRGVHPAQQLGVRRHHDACPRDTGGFNRNSALRGQVDSFSVPFNTRTCPRPAALARVHRGRLRRRLGRTDRRPDLDRPHGYRPAEPTVVPAALRRARQKRDVLPGPHLHTAILQGRPKFWIARSVIFHTKGSRKCNELKIGLKGSHGL